MAGRPNVSARDPPYCKIEGRQGYKCPNAEAVRKLDGNIVALATIVNSALIRLKHVSKLAPSFVFRVLDGCILIDRNIAYHRRADSRLH